MKNVSTKTVLGLLLRPDPDGVEPVAAIATTPMRATTTSAGARTRVEPPVQARVGFGLLFVSI